MLTSITENIWACAHPLSFFGLHLGTRMTVVRLDDGSLLVHSPIPTSPGLKRALDDLGPVAHIVAPNLYHHLYAGDLAAAYPDAKLHAPEGLSKKRKDLEIHATLGPKPDAAWNGQLEQLPMTGSMLGETVFYHPKTSTMISCDVVENFLGHDHWLTRGYLKIGGIYGKPGLSRLLRPTVRDKKAARRAVDAMLDWDPKRIVLSHGEVIESDGRAVLEQTYTWL